MKATACFIFAVLYTTVAAWADLLAHVDTTQGRVSVILQHEKAPLAVANFITLAQGTRPHVDPATGSLSTKPYYVGESFFRIINDVSFRIAQTGSGTGSNSGGPGYTFPDEFDATLRHAPYVLSMANSGLNTNGSQIFFVGNSTPSPLDDVHTVFGIITDPASRAVVDAIHGAGDNGSSIVAVSFERTSPDAVAFDELAQPLPEVAALQGTLAVESGGPVEFMPSSPWKAGTKLSVFRSVDLATWVQTPAVFFGSDSALGLSATLETATGSRAFYHLTRVRYPDSHSPASMGGRTLVVDVPAAGGIITLTFDASGDGGTVHYSGNGSTGSIILLSHRPDGYGATLILQSTTLNPPVDSIGIRRT